MFTLISIETKRLLRKRWDELPATLQTENQVVGKHWVQCGFTMGPSFCSFGCSHCYLPKNANKAPLITLDQFKLQIDENRKMLGQGGGLQITGGDVVDAYWKGGKQNELIEVIKYTNEKGLIPMLMTHGQILLEHPDYLEKLVIEGGLRKLSIHIDTTQAGRPNYPIKEIKHEEQLNPLRDKFYDLIMNARACTGFRLTAAFTVTVTRKNIDGIEAILNWLFQSTRNLDICRTISFQPEASTGRTIMSNEPVTPDEVWNQITNTLGVELPRNHLLFGHPDCSSTATLLIRPRDRRIIRLCGSDKIVRKFWASLLTTTGGIGGKGVNSTLHLLKKWMLVLFNPLLIIRAGHLAFHLMRNEGLTLGMIISVLRGEAKGLNIVMHNFMSEDEVRNPSDNVQERLDACSFRGAVKIGKEWKAVSMCQMNSVMRKDIYKKEMNEHKTQAQ